MKFVKTLLAASIAAAAFGAQAPDYIKNGSFEANVQGEQSWKIYDELNFWEGDPNIELRNSVAGEAYDGQNFVELDTKMSTGGNSSMYQEFSASGDVDFSFFYSARPKVVAATSNGLRYTLRNMTGGYDVDTGTVLEGVQGGSAHSWQEYTERFVLGATTSTFRLTFSAIGLSDSYGGSLDKVSITSAVPEPESYAMMLAGLGLMGAIARRRKAKAA